VAEEGTRAGEERSDNELKMVFCWCPAGRFQMGSPPSEPGRGYDEGSVEVNLTRGFWMGKYEVTQGQWLKVMGTSLAEQQAKAKAGGSSFTDIVGEGLTHPMYLVSHTEVEEFCRKLTASERAAGRLPAGWEYRLPTEAQWEHACRAGGKGVFGVGPGDRLSSADANFNGNNPYGGAPNGPYLEATCPVGRYKPNGWGLYDMHGNVWEWCRDGYDAQLKGGDDPEGPRGAWQRVFRGGSWGCNGRICRSADRGGFGPEIRNDRLGFRVARVSEAPPTPPSEVAGKVEKSGADIPKPPPAAVPWEGTVAGQERSDNDLKMVFCWCPAGSFRMGSPRNEPGRFSSGEDQWSVNMTRGFWLGRFEVTQGQWQKVMRTTLRQQKAKGNAYGEVNGEGDDHPMYFVSHKDAEDVCDALPEVERQAGRLPGGWEYRLPTEAQWEYACRAGGAGVFGFGEDAARLGDYAWFSGNAGGRTHPVGEKSANAFKLRDMLGNVWEWCRDGYVENLKGSDDPAGPRAAPLRVFRGGGWSSGPSRCRPACRNRYAPGARFAYLGFRVAAVRP
jgi:formylglycine-generating enzyme required for sulfatase activity